MGDEETDEHGCGDQGVEKKIDFSSFKKMNMA